MSITQQGADAVISVGDDTLAVLNDVQASQLTADDFVEVDFADDADERPDSPVDQPPSDTVPDTDKEEPEPDAPVDQTPSDPIPDTNPNEDSTMLPSIGNRDNEVLNGSNGPDDSIIIGNGNTINAGGGDDDIIVTGNRTTLNGGNGNDSLIVTGNDSVISGGNGNDELFVTGDNTRLNGGSGNDLLGSSGANSRVNGGDGADQFALGSSTTLGATEPDTFDIIEDFQDGQDTLLLGQTFETIGIADFGSPIRFTDLSITQQGSDAVVSFGDDTLAVLEGVQATQLTADDFVEADGDAIVVGPGSGDGNGGQDGDSKEPKVTSPITRITIGDQILDFSDYEQFIQLQAPNAEVPTDEVGGISLAQFYDEVFYLNENSDVAAAVDSGAFASGYDHFTEFGLSEGRDPSVLYDESFYLENNPDVAQAIERGELSSGLTHFLNNGHPEGRDPSQNFDESDYLLNNSDVAAAVDNGAFGSGFEHYVEFGVDEGRGSDLSAFNESVYLQNNIDVADAVSMGSFSSGFDHFVQFGQFEDRTFNNLSTIEIDQSVLG
ncbi:MAG: hypothetical protein AAF773_01210 [Cyanobacteria bacterium P01_D01_bin.115]